MKGKFIVIEGIDGSGKGTQTELLVNRLKKEGIDLVTDDYPHYDTGFWGKQVGRLLTGEFGELFTISPYLAVLPYMLDEADGSKKIIGPALEKGKIVVSNRYFTSNVHQIAKQPEDEREKYTDWLWEAGYHQMGIIKPDLVLVMSVAPEICRENILKKAKRNYTGQEAMDQAESNFNHQMETAKEYTKMAEKEPDRWIIIDCCRDEKLLPMEEINEIIWNELKRRKIIL
jgi:dTMP kinase